MSDSNPSQQATETARKYLGKPSPVKSEFFQYEEEVAKLAALLDRFAAQARLEEHDACCQMYSPGNFDDAVMCGRGWFCARRIDLERSAKVRESLRAERDESLRADRDALLEFVTNISKASRYKSHPLGYEDSLDGHWKDDAVELLERLAGERT